MKKTYTKEVEAPLLEIRYDCDPTSPREWSNLGYFITVDRDYHSPDMNETLERIVKDTGEEATSQAEHIKMIKKEVENELDEKVLKIYPIVKYEHGAVVYSLGEMHGFDYSNNGFYIVTDKTQKELGTPESSFEKVIREELNIYNKYANGEVYCFTLYDDKGEVEDSCCGFYSLDDIKEQLPSEWEDVDLTEYITYE
jgi:hypothetical protein